MCGANVGGASLSYVQSRGIPNNLWLSQSELEVGREGKCFYRASLGRGWGRGGGSARSRWEPMQAGAGWTRPADWSHCSEATEQLQ